MANTKPKRETVRVRGTFKYPRLGEPDTKFKAEGEYSVSVIVPREIAEPVIAVIDAAAAVALEEAKAKAKTPAEAKKWTTKYLPYAAEEDEDGNETGNVVFKLSMKASGTSKAGKAWTRKPAVFDAKGKPMDGEKVWGGSIGIIVAELIPYAPTPQVGASVKLALEAVQVIELRSGSARTAAGYGFEEEEGYEDVASPSQDEEGVDGTSDAASDEDF